jgi:hypothetical protein
VVHNNGRNTVATQLKTTQGLFIVLIFWLGHFNVARADEFSRLHDLAVAAQKATVADGIKLWKNFLSESSAFAEANSQNMDIWLLRAGAGIATSDEAAGKEAAEKLTALNALASEDHTVRAVMAGLVINGWLATPYPPEPEASSAKKPTIEETVDYLFGGPAADRTRRPEPRRWPLPQRHHDAAPPIRRRVVVFVRPAGGLDHAVQRDVFDDPNLSHVIFFEVVSNT